MGDIFAQADGYSVCALRLWLILLGKYSFEKLRSPALGGSVPWLRAVCSSSSTLRTDRSYARSWISTS